MNINRITISILVFLSLSFLFGCKGKANSHKNSENSTYGDIHCLENDLKEYIQTKNARIGIGVIFNGKDTLSVNGSHDFPMLSVYKFPQAIAVADYCSKNNIGLEDSVDITAEELRYDTWSPMRDYFGHKNISLQLSDILAYSIEQSDNNACDILFHLIGSTEYADSIMSSMDFNEIHILSTEKEMHEDPYLCYANRTTPLQMAALFDRFYRRGMWHDSPVLEAVGQMMMRCETGKNRLPRLLDSTITTIGHKTGTGDVNSQGLIIGVNDAGYVFLPGEHGYAIAVFIADSAYSMEETEKMISEISELVFKFTVKELP